MTAHIGRCRVQISVYFAAMMTFACLLAPDGSALLGVLCCMAHEAGHLLCIRLAGGAVRGVRFGAYGMRIDTAPTLYLSHTKEAWIAASGPAVNLLLAAAGFFLRRQMLLYVNAALAVFNLLPVQAADGGNLLYHLIVRRHTEAAAQKALRICGAVFLLPVCFFAARSFAQNGWNPSLTASTAYLIFLYLRGGKN